MWSARPGFIVVDVSFVLLAVALTAAAVDLGRFGLRSLLVAGLMAVTALGFEEAMTRVARLRVRLAGDLRQDMLAVWGVAGALALPSAAAVVVVVLISAYAWLRHDRPAGNLFHRAMYNGANAVLSCIAAAAVFAELKGTLGAGAWAIGHTLGAVVAILTYTVVNRFIAMCGLLALGAGPRAVLGTRDDNLIELATLCLGALVALAVISQPLLLILAVAPMVTLQRGAAVRQLEAAASTDAKTGLMNALAWEQIATNELARSARDGRSVGVLIVDIDHFKRVNDRFGHLAGDQVLQVVARIIAGAVREYDTVARFGGEEFVAVLPEADTDAAMVVAERLRSRINALSMSDVIEVTDPEQDNRLAVSIGVTTAVGSVELHTLLAEADAALYRAKDQGRNRVVLAGSYGSGNDVPALS